MNHIYIHIPFCIKKCAYCGFYSVTDLSLIDSFIDALVDEVDHYAEIYMPPSPLPLPPQGRGNIKTIYLGGGTPGILSPDHIEKIYSHLKSRFAVDDNCEFSIETNPGTFDRDKLAGFKKAGINRISIGVQSFDDNQLKYLGRIHTAEEATAAIKTASGIFENVGVDMIYGIPGQNHCPPRRWTKVFGGWPKHISCYELTFEKGTPLYKDAGGRNDDDGEAYRLVKSAIEAAGYQQYEISNYALPGFECRHNLAYWSDKSYLGLGPSAHSYDRDKMIRWANRASIEDYIAGNRLDFTEDAQDIDRVIMGLRKTVGMAADSIPKQYKDVVCRLVDDGMLKRESDMISFTPRGVLLENRVLLEIQTGGQAPMV